MPLVTSKEMLLNARNGGYAVGAFNVENMEMVQAVVWAAQKVHAPIILATSASTLKYATPSLFSAIVKAIAQEVDVSVSLHLDHGTSIELCLECLKAGYTSIMIDASQSPFEDNVRISSAVAEFCEKFQVPLEAELGHVGGKEDDLATEGNKGTDPEQAVEFVRRTGVQSLAVAIGTAHGFYQGVPKLNLDLLREINLSVPIPLVLHGASGLSDETVRDCIRGGICKINYATELRAAYSAAVIQVMTQKPDTIDPKVFGREARERVSELVIQKLLVLGCAGKG